MRRILLVTAMLTALVPIAGTSADAQTQNAPIAPFSGYSTGTALHAGALESGTTRLVDTEVAFSGANVNSAGIGAALTNEMKQAYQLVAEAGDKAGGRGSGLEVGLNTTIPNVTDVNQINPGSTVQAFAPVNSGLMTENFTDVDLAPIINSDYLRGQAQAVYSDSVCVLGQPISAGLGYAGTAALVDADPNVLLSTTTGADAVSQSKSFTYLIPNGDGTYGLVTETRQILAPVTLLAGTASPLVIEFAGEWVLRSTATGKSGGAKVEYGPAGSPADTVKIVTVKLAGNEIAALTFGQFLGNEGLALDIPGVAGIAIGEDPRAIGDIEPTSKPELTANGTVAGAASDVVRITTLPLADTLGVDLADLRVGHMESKAVVPAGGITCGIPVSKTGTPASVVAGQDQLVTYTITVPSDIEAFKAVACDLVNIKVVDVTTAEPGVKFDIVSASRDGVINGNTVTWENLGTYKHGDPAIVLTIGLKVPSGSAAGKITDTATATGALGNCKGNDSADATSLTGLATLEAAALTGTAILGSSTTSPEGTTVVLPAVGTPTSPTGPTPRGGVATGAGGASDEPNRMLPTGFALGSLMLVGFLTNRRLGWIG